MHLDKRKRRKEERKEQTRRARIRPAALASTLIGHIVRGAGLLSAADIRSLLLPDSHPRILQLAHIDLQMWECCQQKSAVQLWVLPNMCAVKILRHTIMIQVQLVSSALNSNMLMLKVFLFASIVTKQDHEPHLYTFYSKQMYFEDFRINFSWN